jgi:16S rRNA (adenine1518-N6/adenine1519-N6)-dimethyltransferase
MAGGELRRFIEELGFLPSPDQPDQHFLISERIRDQILNACVGCNGFLEIGPGPGILSRDLVKLGRVRAVDVDPRAKAALAVCAPDAEVRLEDAARLDYVEALRALPKPRAIVSNLPYSITGFVLEALWRNAPLLDRAVLLVQTEVAVRVAASEGDRRRGAVSVLLQQVYDISRVADAPPGAFLPPPKVSSRVLRFDSKGLTISAGLEKVVRAGFQHPRKTLLNNLCAAGYPPERVRQALEFAQLPPAVRAHEAPQTAWANLAAQLELAIG